MRPRRPPLTLLAILALAGGCRTSLNPDIDPNQDGGGFGCQSDADCGGAGWHCNTACAVDGFTPVCLPDGECDACPSLSADPFNCGACGTVCGADAGCLNGLCLGG